MKVAYFIRHSKREDVITHEKHSEANLTKEGIVIAEEFGKGLFSSFKNINIYSSPIPRCIQTGEAILSSNIKKGHLETSRILGNPGAFVYGNALEIFNKLGTVGVVQAINNGEKLPYINKQETGVKFLFNYVKKQTKKAEEKTVSLFITHDAIIAPFINFYLDEVFSEEHWIEFIGGVKINFEEDSVQVQRHYGKKLGSLL